MRYEPPTNVTTSVDMFTWINGTVSNWFFPGAIVSIFAIIMAKLLFSSDNNSISKAFSSASFSCMILSVFCRLLGFVSTGFMSIFIIFTALDAVWMHIENRGESA